MIDKVQISVIIPAYNIAGYIESCLLSVMGQTYDNLDIIVIDDGSTDDTGRICRNVAAHDSRIRYVYQENAGVAMARNRGIELAKGALLSFVDGDDYLEAAMYETMLKYLNGCDLVTCAVERHDSETRWSTVKDDFRGSDTDVKEVLSRMIYDFEKDRLQPLTPWLINKLYRKDIVDTFYRKIDTNIRFAEDSVFLYHYLLRCRAVSFTGRVLYHYRYRKDSAWHSGNERMLENINRVYLCLKTEFEADKAAPIMLKQLQKWISVMACHAVNRYLGFHSEIRIPKYVAEIPDSMSLAGQRIVLYGAGQMGQDMYWLLNRRNIPVALWVDRDAAFYQAQGLQVDPVEMIYNESFDWLLIAVKDRALAGNISTELVISGIESRKIYWKSPICIF